MMAATRANTALLLWLEMGKVSAVNDFFLGGGPSLADAVVGIIELFFSEETPDVITADGEFSATGVRDVWPFVGGEDREGEVSPP